MPQDPLLTNEDVAALADYARIALTEGELDEMRAYLNEAMALLDPILSYDLSDVEPTFHPVGGICNVARDDVVVAGLSLEEALASAGGGVGRYFRVPAIMGDGGAS